MSRYITILKNFIILVLVLGILSATLWITFYTPLSAKFTPINSVKYQYQDVLYGRSSTDLNFHEALQQVSKDCEQTALSTQYNVFLTNEFSGDQRDIEYLLNLYHTIDKDIKYDNNTQSFIAPADKVIYIEAFDQTQISNKESIPGKHCWVVWEENSDAVGVLAFKSKMGFIRKLSVNNFEWFIPSR